VIRLPAKSIVRWRWPIVAAWLAVTAAMVPVGRELQQRLHVGGKNLQSSESTRAEDMISGRFGSPYATFVAVVIQHSSLTLSTRRYAAYVDSISTALARLPFVLKTLDWRTADDPSFLSRNRRITFVLAGLNKNDSATSYVPRLREAVSAVQQRFGSDFETVVTGDPAFDYDVRTIAADDSRLMEQRLIPLTLVFLLIAFSTLVAAMVRSSWASSPSR
jgi:uncharacterized membrane protein YdfJ with MMPL/SSD domain